MRPELSVSRDFQITFTLPRRVGGTVLTFALRISPTHRSLSSSAVARRLPKCWRYGYGSGRKAIRRGCRYVRNYTPFHIGSWASTFTTSRGFRSIFTPIGWDGAWAGLRNQEPAGG